MKKTLLSLGTIVSTIAPVASVIACGDGDVPGHEAPYSISIQADETTPTQANVFIDFKGYVTDSYLKEIKSKIAESIVAANKDSLKYKTMKIHIGDKTVSTYVTIGTVLSINTTPLTDTNKNDLDVVFNLIDAPFDNFMTQIKAKKYFSQFFQKEIWENQHHQIDKVDKDEIKRNLLKYLGYDNSNPDVIDFKYKIISDKFIDFTVTRTNVVANPELHSTSITDSSTGYFDLIEGDLLNMKIFINDDLSINTGSEFIYASPKHPSNSSLGNNISHGNPQNFDIQKYKIVKYLLKQNGYDDKITLKYQTGECEIYTSQLDTLATSASKVFAYGEDGRIAGVNYSSTTKTSNIAILMDFDKKTFKINYSNSPHDQKQWIFGTDGHLVIEPSHEWSMAFEGTYELSDAGDEADTITSTIATASDGTNTIHIQKSSANLMAKNLINFLRFFIN